MRHWYVTGAIRGGHPNGAGVSHPRSQCLAVVRAYRQPLAPSARAKIAGVLSTSVHRVECAEVDWSCGRTTVVRQEKRHRIPFLPETAPDVSSSSSVGTLPGLKSYFDSQVASAVLDIQYFFTLGSILSAQARMPPSRLTTFG